MNDSKPQRTACFRAAKSMSLIVRRWRLEKYKSYCYAMLLGSMLMPAMHCSSKFDALEENSRWVELSEAVYFLSVDSLSDWLCTSSLDGEGFRRLGSGPVQEYVFAAEGDQIAIVYSNNSCEIVNVESGDLTKIDDSCLTLDWSPSGSHVLVTRMNRSIGIYERANGNFREMVKPAALHGEPRWSQDGSLFHYCDRLSKYNCYEVQLDSGEIRKMGEYSEPADYWHKAVGAERLHFSQFDSAKITWDRRIFSQLQLWAITEGGSLILDDNAIAPRRTLLRSSSNWRSADLGPSGFINPYFTADGQYVLGEVDERIVIVEVASGRAGIVAKGRHPLVWLPDYRPVVHSNVDLGFYMFIKLSGY